MKEIKVKVQDKIITHKLPTILEEIDDKFLTEVANSVNIAKHYSLVGLVHYDRINNIILAGKENKKINIGVIPIFIKGDELKDNLNVNFGQKVIIPKSEIELGIKVAVPGNPFNLFNFADSISSRIKGRYPELEYDDKDNCVVYFIEFKLIPNSAIKGAYNGVPDFSEFEYIKVDNN